MKNNLFGFPGGDWSESEFNEAMTGLIKKGLALKVIVGGKEFFKLTEFGTITSKHMHSDPSTKN